MRQPRASYFSAIYFAMCAFEIIGRPISSVFGRSFSSNPPMICFQVVTLLIGKGFVGHVIRVFVLAVIFDKVLPILLNNFEVSGHCEGGCT